MPGAMGSVRMGSLAARICRTAICTTARTNRTQGALCRTFSQYENYSRTSKTYDSLRVAIASDTFLDFLTRHARTINHPLQLLDVGCGSGTYLNILGNKAPGGAIGLEFNDGMLSKAMAKGLDVRKGSILDMPFMEQQFDVVTTTQVLHHLEDAENRHTQEFKALKVACAEVSRVLKPKGAWLISTQTPTQHIDGFWWSVLVPESAKLLAKQFPPIDVLKDCLNAAGFNNVKTEIPSKPLVREDVYLDVTSPFRQDFRDADSTWALATPAEIDNGLEWLQDKIDAGEAETFLAEREALRSEVGQTTTVIAIKDDV